MNSFKRKYKRGFTLVELLVVLAIFVIITTVVLARQNKFSSDIQLTNLAYQIALSIRQAQVYGLGVKGASSNYQIGYGIDFDKASSSSYALVADNNVDQLYDGAPTPADNVVNNFNLQLGASISNLCVTDYANVKTCSKTGAFSTLDILFLRPNPAANISIDHHFDPGGSVTSPSYTQASITIISALGDRYKCINVYQTGQVAVSASSTTATSTPC